MTIHGYSKGVLQKIKEHEMKNLRRTVFLFGAALCLLAACADDPANNPGDDPPSVDLSVPAPSALPALAAGIKLVDSETEARALFIGAVASLPDVFQALKVDADERFSIRGSSASRAVSSYSYGPFNYHNDKTLISGMSVTGYFKGSQTSGDYEESVADAQFELDLLQGTTKDTIAVKGKIANAMYIKERKKTIMSYEYDIDEKSVYALTVTDTAEKTGGRFIFELVAKGKFEIDYWNGDVDFSGLNTTVALKVYDDGHNELWNVDIDITENSDIFGSLTGVR
jgi:hypothetical protein